MEGLGEASWGGFPVTALHVTRYIFAMEFSCGGREGIVLLLYIIYILYIIIILFIF